MAADSARTPAEQYAETIARDQAGERIPMTDQARETLIAELEYLRQWFRHRYMLWHDEAYTDLIARVDRILAGFAALASGGAHPQEELTPAEEAECEANTVKITLTAHAPRESLAPFTGVMPSSGAPTPPAQEKEVLPRMDTPGDSTDSRTASANSAARPERHGVDCRKVAHEPDPRIHVPRSGPQGGWLHAADDDSPYDVDGVIYCGRCHVWMGR